MAKHSQNARIAARTTAGMVPPCRWKSKHKQEQAPSEGQPS